MPKHRRRPARAIVLLPLLLLLLGACSAGRPGGADVPNLAGAGPEAPLTVPTWPAAGQGPSDLEATSGAATDPAVPPSTVPDQPLGSGPGATGQPDAGPTIAGDTSPGGSAASDPTLLSLSAQAERAIQELDAALSDDAAAATDEGGLP